MGETNRLWLDDQDGLIIVGDVLDGLEHLDDNSVEVVVTDPPYELNFMGRDWDNAGVSFRRETWEACWRVLKPGGHMVVFGGTRTHHRMWCAIEDAGFEVRDMLTWMYGQGFPKSLDVSKAIDKAAGAEREVIRKGFTSSDEQGDVYAKGINANFQERQLTAPATDDAKQWEGWGTALKPALEPILLARKPLLEKNVAANVLKWGTGALNIDGTRIGTTDEDKQTMLKMSRGFVGRKWGRPELANYGYEASMPDKTLSVPHPQGRWPANVLLECTCADDTEGGHAPDCPAGMLDGQSGDRSSPWIGNSNVGAKGGKVFGGGEQKIDKKPEYKDSGGASRFFYCPKASKKEREGSKHPTQKPLALMRWLVRLVTPPDGIILDPFCGSGSTLVAAVEEGHGFIGIDLSPEYCATAQHRVEEVKRG